MSNKKSDKSWIRHNLYVRLHQRLINIDEDDDDHCSEYTYRIRTSGAGKFPRFEIKIGNKHVTMMADSGESVNLLSEND